MENMMEWIMPLVFLVIWGLSKMFGGNKEGEQGEQPASSSPPVEVDRTREIQEEIRRRIAERKQAQQPPPAAQTPQQPPQYGQTTLRPATTQTQPYAPPEHTFQRSQPTAQTQELIQEMEEMEAETARENLEKQLADQRRALQEARAHAARVKGTKTWGESRSAGQLHDLRAEVLSSLQNANGSRKAFLLMEILGAPVSVRQEGGFLHFWEQ